MKIAVIGGGAAGFFAALSVKKHYPDATVTIFEKRGDLLAKVKISGGGRCNFTNACTNVEILAKAYPRGGNQMKRLLKEFGTQDTVRWFAERGVPSVVQEDNCVFPASQNSMSIVNCLLKSSMKAGVEIVTNAKIEAIEIMPEKNLKLIFLKNPEKPAIFDKVIVTTGGSPKAAGISWLEKLGHRVISPVPSLFSFNIPSDEIRLCMGITHSNTILSVEGHKFTSSGTILITHWGMSGPAVLKLSSYAARALYQLDYNFVLKVNWTGIRDHQAISEYLKTFSCEHGGKQVSTTAPFEIKARVWNYLLKKNNISPKIKWEDVNEKKINQFTNALSHDAYKVNGKSSWKEEFVTCGGISLKDIDISSMRSKVVENLYFAGEVLDIDAITGGYNLQCAWTTGYICGLLRK